MNNVYIAIDLKSFYASVECVERGLDPLNTNLVVADISRTEKTICLAVTPPLKALGVGGRPRLFEVVQQVAKVNRQRRRLTAGKMLAGRSCFADELARTPRLAVDYITAPPRMAHYIEYSSRIYEIYLKYVSAEDIHVYSIDEVFISAAEYIKARRTTAAEFAALMLADVFRSTGITATAGIGTNLYLAKVAMDIVAKKMQPDSSGARIAELDERSYRRLMWEHTPLTDFWRVGRGYAEKLEANGMFTMGDVARRSLEDEALLFRLFGVNAELLIDHAWGHEPCTIADIKAYRPAARSLSQGQVLQEPYGNDKARLVMLEMADMLALDLVYKGLLTGQVVMTIGYDSANESYEGEFTVDAYGRKIPKHAHGTETLPRLTSSSALIRKALGELFDRITDKALTIRRINIAACGVIPEAEAERGCEQLDLFTDYAAKEREEQALKREKRMQQAVLRLKEKYGKNAVIRAMSLQDGATAMSRNRQIGGHRA